MIYSKICQEMVDLPVQEQIQVLNMIGGAVSRGVNVSVIRRLCLARAAASLRGIKASNGKSISDCIDQCLSLLNTNQWEHAFLILTAMPDELEHTRTTVRSSRPHVVWRKIYFARKVHC